ncbi:putative transporter, major facilitator superfamily [Hyphopichia burtonii NRRL Y-1933]|uniref:Putative transporter, major facilitator superfamily n=1 Tax=Hyphopichia burtonii NRRL Y-1933 TaxID=984485 RepID=A0A1E4RL54_9ASCO|nr:putative transporter, major facilitator superfamily [Hyphopichia burtonii NRRL Y-1933]ODV68002.1 putative transporter, major facilitator superfamily [Hyphopichia burtonii NRRL Y-1933]
MTVKNSPDSRLGIKQPNIKEVTGTIVMLDDPEETKSNAASSVNTSNHDSLSLKRTNTGIILHPQPHDDQNDPLTWPTLRKDICFAVIGLQTFLGGGQTPVLAAGLSQLSKEFDKPLHTVTYLVGGFMLALGVGSVFASPTAILYGKRFVYLLGIVLFLAGSLWGSFLKTFGSLMGARIIMGFGASPTESLASASLSELYFQHERAYRTGIYTMLLLGGKNIVPLLSGLVFQYLDRHWLFWILSIFLGFTLICTFLFVPETFWDRTPTPNKRSIEESKAARAVRNYHPPSERPNAWALPNSSFYNASLDSDVESLPSSIHPDTQSNDAPIGITKNTHHHHHHGDGDQNDDTASIQSTPKSFVQRLSVFSGRHTKDSWWMVALRPFFLYSYPAVLFGSFIYSFSVVWLIVISEAIASIFEAPGYNYSNQTVGLFYIGPFIGGILGSLSAGILGDRLTRFVVSKNHGVYEPEFRLLMLIPATFFITFGLMGFGWSTKVKDAWIGPIIFFSCVSFGSSIASTTSISFTVDTYKMFAAELLVSFNFMKNLMGFVFSLFNTQFIDSTNTRTTYLVYGAIQIFLSSFGILIYIYGKKIRAWTDEKEILKTLYHVDNIPPSIHEKQSLNNENSNDNSIDDSNDDSDHKVDERDESASPK